MRSYLHVTGSLFYFLLHDKWFTETAWQLFITYGNNPWGLWWNDNKVERLRDCMMGVCSCVRLDNVCTAKTGMLKGGCVRKLALQRWEREEYDRWVSVSVYLLRCVTVNHVRHERDLPVQEGGWGQVQWNLVCHHHCDVHSWRNWLNCPTWESTERERDRKTQCRYHICSDCCFNFTKMKAAYIFPFIEQSSSACQKEKNVLCKSLLLVSVGTITIKKMSISLSPMCVKKTEISDYITVSVLFLFMCLAQIQW